MIMDPRYYIKFVSEDYYDGYAYWAPSGLPAKRSDAACFNLRFEALSVLRALRAEYEGSLGRLVLVRVR